MKELLAGVVFGLGLIVGYDLRILTTSVETKPTWAEIVAVMPPSIKEDIAIDFCVAHRRMCRHIPLSSPINPMDGKNRGQEKAD